MSYIRINKDKAVKKWTPVLENMGVTNEDRLDWLSEYAEYHTINENAYVNATTAGMGGVLSPQPGTLPGLLGGGDVIVGGFGAHANASGLGIGSGDVGHNLLPVAMKIAAQTIGLDLVAVKPTPGPKIDLLYIDFQYDDLRDVGGNARPQVFKLTSTDTAAYNALTATISFNLAQAPAIRETSGGLEDGQLFLNFLGNTIDKSGPGTNTKLGWLEFLGFSRVDGKPMFRAWRQANSTNPGVAMYPYQYVGA